MGAQCLRKPETNPKNPIMNLTIIQIRLRRLRQTLFALISGSLLTAATAHAQVSFLNSTNLNNASGGISTYSKDFDPDDAADALVLIFATEANAPGASVMFGGNPMQYAGVGLVGNNPVAIYYLNNPPVDNNTLEVTVTTSGTNGFSCSVIALGTTDDKNIEVLTSATEGNAAGPLSIDLTMPKAGSFVLAGFNSSAGSGTAAATTGLTPLNSGDIGSMVVAFGYAENAPEGTNTYEFTTNTAASSHIRSTAVAFSLVGAPEILSLNPADDATEVQTNADLVVTFNKTIEPGTGNIELWQSGGGAALETFDVTSSPQLTFSDSTLTIDPTSNFTPGVGYYVLIDATAVEDTSGGAFAGISDPTEWNFTADNAPPTVVSFNPADDSSTVSITSNISLTFNEPVSAGTGNIELWQTGGGSALETFDVATSPQLSFDGATLTIVPSANFTVGTGYYILIGPSAVVDASANPFAGISDPAVWNFATDSAPPVIASLFPADNSNYVAVQTNLVANFSETISAGSGNIELWESGGGSPLETFDVASSAQITFSGNKLTIDPIVVLNPASGYYVIIPSTAVLDISGNPFPGLTAATAWNFTTLGNVAPISVVNGPEAFAQANPPVVSTFSFDAGASADMLVVAVSSELGTTLQGATVGITYDGVPFIRSGSSGNPLVAEIYYLDLTTTSYAGGAADLVVDLSDYTSRNGLALGVVSIAGSGETIVLHSTADGGASSQAVTLTTTASDAFSVACFNSNNTSGTISVDPPLTTIFANPNIGSARGAAGYEESVAAGDHTYSWTLPAANATPRRAVAASFVSPAAVGRNTYADWIAGFPGVGGLTGLNDDPDGDGSDNGVENYFGTNPGVFSQGLVAGSVNTGAKTFTFTHPLNGTPASDLTATYRWSTDLANFHDDGSPDGAGTTTVTFSDPIPAGEVFSVTATISGSVTPDKLFVAIKVDQN